MKRREFFKKSTVGAIVAGAIPLNSFSAEGYNTPGDRSKDNWLQLGSGQKEIPVRKTTGKYDVAVLGGGMSGISAAVSAARNGAKTVLVQDRPVLGGNASSEMRVTVNSAHPERETGIIEEILIENWVHNIQESYPVWDHVLYNYVVKQENLTLLLNTQAIDVEMEDNFIKSAKCWGYTNETEYTIYAKQFIDCSGDGLLAAKAGAEYRTGREGKEEFGESYAPDQPDGWTMGECIMMITKDMGRPVPFTAPDYAIPYDAGKGSKKGLHRGFGNLSEGFWWVEVCDKHDIIANREDIRHKIMGYFYGVWDYVKNSGKFPNANNLVLDWVGSIPGRRESRRFMGDHILTQGDLESYRHFEDAVAFGGWSLDEHNPGGIENLEEPASYFHNRFEKIYEIPYRCLYSKNISNLSFAGRNVSVSHIALSSTRITGTCATMGQAAGTGAALCVKKKVNPHELGQKHISELQEQLLRDDSFIPNRPATDKNDLAKQAKILLASSTISGDVNNLTDGISRGVQEAIHHWEADGINAKIQLEWEKPVIISKVELKGDTNVHRKLMMHKDPTKNNTQVLGVPPELIKKFKIEVKINERWIEVTQVDNNITRLMKTSFDEVKTSALKITLLETWGHKNAKLFEVRCYS